MFLRLSKVWRQGSFALLRCFTYSGPTNGFPTCRDYKMPTYQWLHILSSHQTTLIKYMFDQKILILSLINQLFGQFCCSLKFQNLISLLFFIWANLLLAALRRRDDEKKRNNKWRHCFHLTPKTLKTIFIFEVITFYMIPLKIIVNFRWDIVNTVKYCQQGNNFQPWFKICHQRVLQTSRICGAIDDRSNP